MRTNLGNANLNSLEEPLEEESKETIDEVDKILSRQKIPYVD